MYLSIQKLKNLTFKIVPFVLFTLGSASFMSAHAQNVDFGVNLSGGKEPVKIDANNMEVRDKEGLAILTGNVSVSQGDRIIRAGKMKVYYNKAEKKKGQKTDKKGQSNGLGATGVDKMEVSDKVYIKNGTQIAVGDYGTFNSKNNVMVLTGKKVILRDGENVATGCQLTAHMDSGKAFLKSCSSSQDGRVSIIVNRDK